MDFILVLKGCLFIWRILFEFITDKLSVTVLYVLSALHGVRIAFLSGLQPNQVTYTV